MIALFDTIDYLKNGSPRQQRAHRVLNKNLVLKKLQPFHPILAGTIPLNIDIENSDLDIICYFTDKKEFMQSLKISFGEQENFIIRQLKEPDAIVANFFADGFEIEVFGQAVPVKEQNAYRHMIIEYKLLEKYGEAFRQKIIELKQQGMKTEPAFALLLGLKGDPYTGLLKFEKNVPNSDNK